MDSLYSNKWSPFARSLARSLVCLLACLLACDAGESSRAARPQLCQVSSRLTCRPSSHLAHSKASPPWPVVRARVRVTNIGRPNGGRREGFGFCLCIETAHQPAKTNSKSEGLLLVALRNRLRPIGAIGSHCCSWPRRLDSRSKWTISMPLDPTCGRPLYDRQTGKCWPVIGAGGAKLSLMAELAEAH